MRSICCWTLAALLLALPSLAQTKKAPGSLPPPGKPLPDGQQRELADGVAELRKQVKALHGTLDPKLRPLLADVQIYVNAVDYPLRFGEAIDYKKAKAALAGGAERAKQLREGKAPWVTAGGPRGYVSKIDGSVQPYLLAVPKGYKPGDARKWRVDFFCHGRGETLLELNFINGKPGEAGERFYVQPYGRYCVANKFAGEIDVLEILDSLKQQYPIDDDRVVLTGFSMGGAAVWHLAVHYPDVWCCASPGAGFAETERYQHLEKSGELAAMPWYERSLLHWYDATDYALNLYNLPLIAYAGTEDPQQQSGDVMAEACKELGINMQRIYGQGVGHKYEPKAKEELDRRLGAYAAKGRNDSPASVKLQTWTLRYNRMFWLTIDALDHHWQEARVDADVQNGVLRVKTANVAAFSMNDVTTPKYTAVEIDGEKVLLAGHYVRQSGAWKDGDAPRGLHKRHGLQGPIDDAFLDPFLMVRPSGKAMNDKVGAWADAEMKRAIRQWHNIFRGDAPVQDDLLVGDEEIADRNLVLWGDPSSNKVLAKIADQLPIRWTKDAVIVGDQRYDAATHVPILIYPNPLNPKHYVVINSGFTFREDANGTNSRQIPRLPDYAIVDLTTPPDAHYPGKIVRAGFFGERWELQPNDGKLSQ